MLEFFCFLLLSIVWINFSFFIQHKKDQAILVPRVEPPSVPVAQTTLNVVARSVDDLVGTYNNEQIYRYVQVDDGRMFIFESVAVERSPGVYHADNTDGVYIIVDKYLLYREVPVE